MTERFAIPKTNISNVVDARKEIDLMNATITFLQIRIERYVEALKFYANDAHEDEPGEIAKKALGE